MLEVIAWIALGLFIAAFLASVAAWVFVGRIIDAVIKGLDL